MLLIELRRAFKNKLFYISLGIGMIIAVLHFVFSALPVARDIDYFLQYEKSMTTVANVFSNWMGGNTFNIYGYIFFLLLPLLATIPFADSFYTDMKYGFNYNIVLRTSRKKYLRAKYLATFFSGGSVVVIPLIVNLLLCSAILPSIYPQVVKTHMGILDTSMFFHLYFSNPYLYILIYFIIDFVFAGLLACITLAMSIIAEQRFVALITPFIVYVFINSVCEMADKIWFSIHAIVQPAMPYSRISITLAEILILAFVTWFGFVERARRHDIL